MVSSREAPARPVGVTASKERKATAAQKHDLDGRELKKKI
jgi:hypothetical protein